MYTYNYIYTYIYIFIYIYIYSYIYIFILEWWSPAGPCFWQSLGFTRHCQLRSQPPLQSWVVQCPPANSGWPCARLAPQIKHDMQCPWSLFSSVRALIGWWFHICFTEPQDCMFQTRTFHPVWMTMVRLLDPPGSCFFCFLKRCSVIFSTYLCG